jgi:putative iron-regulated protein
MTDALTRLFRSIAVTSLAVAMFIAPPAAGAPPKTAQVVATYADIALGAYSDSLSEARKLKAAVDALIAAPSAERLAAARRAWIDARVPYMQTEAYRFGNKIVDDWEGRVNAWPLDEGLIDYVDTGAYGTASDSNPLYTANVIANPTIRVEGRRLDARQISKSVLRSLQEAEKIEANVATGYHAIEFLLWGQDLNGTGPGAGNRPHSDFIKGAGCTGGHCDRRVQYLKTSMDLLVEDLAWMVEQWKANGAARRSLARNETAALITIFTGLGSLSYGEMAGERMKLGLLLNDPEEEHDCFSDNTHNSHFYDVVGIENVYLGRYKRVDGSTIEGPSVSDLVRDKAPDVDARVRLALSATVTAMGRLKSRAETKEAYDQMIGEGNAEGNAVVEAAIEALIAQTKEFERAIAVLGLQAIAFEGSDSLDDPGKALAKKK